MRGPQLGVWILTPFCLILDIYGTWFLFFALLAGVFRKFGMIKFSKAELRKYIFCHDFQMMGFMSCATMAHSSASLIMLAPVLLHGYLICGKIIEEHNKPDHSVRLTSFWQYLNCAPLQKAVMYGNDNR